MSARSVGNNVNKIIIKHKTPTAIPTADLNKLEISDKYDSIKAINVIKNDFSVGEAFPVQVAIKSDSKLTDSKGVNDLEALSQSINKIKGVDYLVASILELVGYLLMVILVSSFD